MKESTSEIHEVYGDLEMALGQFIYEDRYASQGGLWRAVEMQEVWFEKARLMISFIEDYPAA